MMSGRCSRVLQEYLRDTHTHYIDLGEKQESQIVHIVMNSYFHKKCTLPSLQIFLHAVP